MHRRYLEKENEENIPKFECEERIEQYLEEIEFPSVKYKKNNKLSAADLIFYTELAREIKSIPRRNRHHLEKDYLKDYSSVKVIITAQWQLSMLHR